MATIRILYSQTGNTGKMVAVAIDRLLDSQAEMRRIRLILNNASSGNDWAALAAELGLPATQPGADAAQALWTIFSNAADRIDHAAVSECSRLDMG